MYMVEHNSKVRIALMLSDSDKRTFNGNLIKIIEVVLYNLQKNFVNIYEINKYIEENYSLVFTEEEIKVAIKDGKNNSIQYTTDGRIYLLPAIFDKYKEKEANFKLRNLIELFVLEKEYDSNNIDEYEEILYKFFLYVIDNNVKDLLSIINNEKPGVSHKNDSFSNIEKKFINDFLNWDNKEKNEIVYSIGVYCCDYCALTVRKDGKSFNTVFNKKTFLLDANVIFRLFGLNNEERKQVTKAFIAKCKSVGINLVYSNFTKKELFGSIDYNAKMVVTLTRCRADISIGNYNKFIDAYINEDFLSLYLKWANKKGNVNTDITKFKRDLKAGISEILDEFKQVDFPTFEQQKKHPKFADVCQSLSEFKMARQRDAYDASIKTDINNWFYIKERREENPGKSIFDTNSFLISADNLFVNWSLSYMPGALAIVVRPSVWYSLILKYCGRSEDDYLAFSSFLNLRLNIENEEIDSIKPEILSVVLEKVSDKDLANEILLDIDENLDSDYRDIHDANLIVEVSEKKLLEKKLQEGKVIGTQEGKELGLVEGKELGLVEGKETGKEETLDKMAEMQVILRLKRYGQYQYLNSLFIKITLFCAICSILYIIYIFSTNNNISDFSNYKGLNLSIIIAVISILLNAIKRCLNNIIEDYFCSGDEEKLKKRFKQKLLRDYKDC